MSLLSAFLTFTTAHGSFTFTIFDKPDSRHFLVSGPSTRKIVGPLICKERHIIRQEAIAVMSDETVPTPIDPDRWHPEAQKEFRWDNTTGAHDFEIAAFSHIVKVTSPFHNPEHSFFISAFLKIRHAPESNGTTSIFRTHGVTWYIQGHSRFQYFDRVLPDREIRSCVQRCFYSTYGSQ